MVRLLLLLLAASLSSCSDAALAGLAAGMQSAGGRQPAPTPSQAVVGAPYCYDGGYGGAPLCHYYSLQACQTYARTYGGTCFPNR